MEQTDERSRSYSASEGLHRTMQCRSDSQDIAYACGRIQAVAVRLCIAFPRK